MKVRNMFIILTAAAVLILGGCAKQPKNEYFELPDTKWGMTLDEVLKVYGVTKEEVGLLTEGRTGSAFAIDDGRKMFGEKTSRILFNFLDPAKGKKEPKFCQVDIYYPDSTDMNHVKEEMKKIYGSTTIKGISIYDNFDILDIGELRSDDYAESEILTLWAGSTINEVVPKAEAQDYLKLWEEVQLGLNKETWTEFSENARLVTVVCASGTEAFPKFEKNGISIGAENLIFYNEFKSQLSNP